MVKRVLILIGVALVVGLVIGNVSGYALKTHITAKDKQKTEEHTLERDNTETLVYGAYDDRTFTQESKPFKRNPALLPLDHATRSIKLATLFIDLTEDEEFAIRYHDGLYESANYAVKGNETPLYLILHYADLWSSRVTEGSTDEGSEE